MAPDAPPPPAVSPPPEKIGWGGFLGAMAVLVLFGLGVHWLYDNFYDKGAGVTVTVVDDVPAHGHVSGTLDPADVKEQAPNFYRLLERALDDGEATLESYRFHLRLESYLDRVRHEQEVVRADQGYWEYRGRIVKIGGWVE